MWAVGGRLSMMGSVAAPRPTPLLTPHRPAGRAISRSHPQTRTRIRAQTPRDEDRAGETAPEELLPELNNGGTVKIRRKAPEIVFNFDDEADKPKSLEEPAASPSGQALAATPSASEDEDEKTAVQKFLFPDKEELPDDITMSIWDHFDELRERVFISTIVAGVAIVSCFCFSRDLVAFLELPVADTGVRFLQLSPGEYFFTTVKVAGYSGLLLAAPTIIYEVSAYVVPGLTLSERQVLGPIVFGSSFLFYAGILFSYSAMVPAALRFFINYGDGVVESLYSIDQYFEFVLVLMFSTGLAFQVPVIQLLLGQSGVFTSQQMLSVWRYVVVGSVVFAAIVTPSTDPFTQTLLAAPLLGLYFAGAWGVSLIEKRKALG